jgi:serpin B
MLYAGAEAATKEEMAAALSFDLPEPTLHAAFNATALALSGRHKQLAGKKSGPPSTGDLSLRSVNAAFARKGVIFEMPYLDTLAIHYGTGMFAADFVDHAERERMAINQWTEDRTNGRINDLLPMGSIDPMVELVLVSAIYFKGSWLQPFSTNKTHDELFHAPAGDVMVSMMNGHAEQYAEGDGYQALELPYIAPAVRMLFVLPAEERFDEIEARLSSAFVGEIRDGLSRRAVTAKVPKFSFHSTFELKPALRALGMESVFLAGTADLSGIAGDAGELYVSDVFHSTFVAVDEQGTEAAAATAIVTSDDSAPSPADFFLDRPFIFMVYDEPTEQVLFAGRVTDPTAR